MTRIVDREVLVGFIDEAKSYLPAILQGMAAYQADNTALDGLEVAHRHIHTIKGASSMVGLAGLSHMAYYVEETLEEVGAGHFDLSGETERFMRQTLDAIETYLDTILAGTLQEKPLVTAVVKSYRRLHNLPAEQDDTAVGDILDQLGDTASHYARTAPAAAPVAVPTPPRPLSSYSENDDDISPELLEAFIIEAEEHLHTIATRLADFDRDPSQHDCLAEVRRAVHTLKGGAGTVGRHNMAHLAHRMEDLLDLLDEDEVGLSTNVMMLLFNSADMLEDLLTKTVSADTLKVLYEAYDRLTAVPATPAPTKPHLEPLGDEAIIDLSDLTTNAAKHAPSPNDKPTAVSQPAGEMVRVPLERLDGLVRSVSELVITRTTFEQHMGHMVRLVDELWHSFERLRHVSTKLETEYEVTTLSGGRTLQPGNGDGHHLIAPGAKSEFDELQLDRYTEFHRLSRELTETTSDLRTIGNELRNLTGDFDGVLNRQGRLSSEIQDKLMRTRMVPFATIATRLHRTVRVVSQKQNKQVDLVLLGEQIELDKKVLEEMADPLLHALRNAVDHGIEPPELRQVLGKNERGQITIQAYHQGNQVVITIHDDGAGLDPQILRQRAIKLNYVTESESLNLSEEELFSLIFAPGFSTAETVSELSGRGVGLDVLKTAVHKLKGTLRVASTSGQGTTFTIRLPMTLAVTRALLVRAQSEVYALPLGAVSQIMRLERNELEAIGHNQVLKVNGEVYPLHYLSRVLHLEQNNDDTAVRLPIIILDTGGEQIALVVDEIIEGREIVVKTLGSHLRHVHGVTGATLMGDGRIVLILNPAELVSAPEQHLQHTWTAPILSETGETVAYTPLSVLIVDDSVSVRRVVSNLIKNAGWHPQTAKDGLDALTQIQSAAVLPNVILLDIEMPRMDGYELTATLQANELYRHIPIVMLTSRAGDKHRQKALSLGVAAYVVKPYQDEQLLATVERLGRGQLVSG